jgi:acyl carrier protein
MDTISMEAVDQKLWVIMAEKLGLDPESIKMNDSFADDLGVDSLDVLALFTDVEKEFGFRMQDEDAEKITTVKALVSYVHMHLS